MKKKNKIFVYGRICKRCSIHYGTDMKYSYHCPDCRDYIYRNRKNKYQVGPRMANRIYEMVLAKKRPNKNTNLFYKPIASLGRVLRIKSKEKHDIL